MVPAVTKPMLSLLVDHSSPIPGFFVDMSCPPFGRGSGIPHFRPLSEVAKDASSSYQFSGRSSSQPFSLKMALTAMFGEVQAE